MTRTQVDPLPGCRCGCGQVGVRLLACGLCHEENGEEVHPHPECSETYTEELTNA